MKFLVSIVFSLFGLSQLSIASPVDDREINKGTVLIYSVKDGAVSYKLKVTIMVWNPELPVQMQWQTTGGKVMKG